jgi:hypothetical protein
MQLETARLRSCEKFNVWNWMPHKSNKVGDAAPPRGTKLFGPMNDALGFIPHL